MNKRILSGVQPSGQLHIGNYFGMIDRMISLQSNSDLFCFVANYHSLTSINNKDELEKNTSEAFIDLLALGINPKKSTFWIQSHVPEVTELAWILSNFSSILDLAISNALGPIIGTSPFCFTTGIPKVFPVGRPTLNAN